MKKLLSLLTFLATVAFAAPAFAAGATPALVVAACGTPPRTLTAGQPYYLLVDVNGNMCTGLSVSGANAAAGTTGAAVPAAASYTGVNVGGTLRGQTGVSLAAGTVFAASIDIASLNGTALTTTVPVSGSISCSNCSGSGVVTVDEAAFTAATSTFAGGGGFFQTTATNNPLTSGQQGMFQVTANRALFVNLRTSGGVEFGTSSAPVQVSLANTATNATAVKVDGSGVTQPVSGTVTANAGTGTFNIQSNASVNVAQVAGTTTDTNSGTKSAGTQRVVIATDQPQLTNPLLVTGSTDNPCYIRSGTGTLNDTANHANCKASAGTYKGARALNTSATLAYLRMYNLATDATCSSSTGFVESIPIPASATGAGYIDILSNFAYSTGVAYCVTGGSANNDNTAPPAGVFVTLSYD